MQSSSKWRKVEKCRNKILAFGHRLIEKHENRRGSGPGSGCPTQSRSRNRSPALGEPLRARPVGQARVQRARAVARSGGARRGCPVGTPTRLRKQESSASKLRARPARRLESSHPAVVARQASLGICCRLLLHHLCRPHLGATRTASTPTP